MASAGNLVVTLTSDQSQFIAGMSSAGSHLDKFGNTITTNTGHMQKFSLHTLASRGNLRLFSETTGIATGNIHHLIGVMGIGGPIIAGLAAGILAVKASLEADAEAAKKAKEEQSKYFDIIFKISELKSGRLPLTEEMKEAIKRSDELGNKIIELQKHPLQNIRLGYTGGDISAIRRTIEENYGNELSQINRLKAALQINEEIKNKPHKLDAHERSVMRIETGGRAAAVFMAEHMPPIHSENSLISQKSDTNVQNAIANLNTTLHGDLMIINENLPKVGATR
jgi:hypothetical protein